VYLFRNKHIFNLTSFFEHVYHYVVYIAGVCIESKSSCGCRLTAVLLLVMD